MCKSGLKVFNDTSSSSVDDPDNAKLYIRSNDTMKFLADLSGAQGIKGETGPVGLFNDAQIESLGAVKK